MEVKSPFKLREIEIYEWMNLLWEEILFHQRIDLWTVLKNVQEYPYFNTQFDLEVTLIGIVKMNQKPSRLFTIFAPFNSWACAMFFYMFFCFNLKVFEIFSYFFVQCIFHSCRSWFQHLMELGSFWFQCVPSVSVHLISHLNFRKTCWDTYMCFHLRYHCIYWYASNTIKYASCRDVY